MTSGWLEERLQPGALPGGWKIGGQRLHVGPDACCDCDGSSPVGPSGISPSAAMRTRAERLAKKYAQAADEKLIVRTLNAFAGQIQAAHAKL
ncbi:MAG: hypothetical protein ACRD04_01455 [Terriglobales bacterium]